MITFRFKKLFLYTLFLLPFLLPSEEANTKILLQSKLMENDWNFLPDVPKSFKKTTSNTLKISTKIKKFYIDVGSSEINLNLKRAVEPIDVSLSAKKKSLKISYQIQNDLIIFIGSYNQESDDQRFNCYNFNGLLVGSCQNADINISSTNPKYDVLEDNLVIISGEINSKNIGLRKRLDQKFINLIEISYEQIKHNFNWLSPIEDITSPTLLGLNIGNSTLGEEIENLLGTLPQRDTWKTHILNLRLHNQYDLGKNFSIEPALHIKFLDYKKYNNNESIPNMNFKYSLALSYNFKKTKISFFGDYYQNNLLGFENITLNQRTERYFNRPYGELGLRVKFGF